MGNDVVEKEAGGGKSHVVEHWHGFYPLGKIVDCDYDIFVTIDRHRFALHEIDAPFSKGVENDD